MNTSGECSPLRLFWNSTIHAVSGEIFEKGREFPQSEFYYPTLAYSSPKASILAMGTTSRNDNITILPYYDIMIWQYYNSKLGIDDLQFAYQPGVSANMCTWTAIETASYFLRNGGNVFCCLMDMTKAFDLVKHSILFRNFLKAGLSPIFIRLLIFININQYANIRWDGKVSSCYSMNNGVRQGAILTLIRPGYLENNFPTFLGLWRTTLKCSSSYQFCFNM